MACMPDPQIAAPGISIGHSELQGAPDSHGKSIVDFDAEISDRAFDFGVTAQS